MGIKSGGKLFWFWFNVIFLFLENKEFLRKVALIPDGILKLLVSRMSNGDELDEIQKDIDLQLLKRY